MKVEEIFEKIMRARNWEKKELANYIGVHPSTISSKLGAQWDSHFRIFLKLLPDMAELDIIADRDLLGKRSHDTKPLTSADKTRKIKSNLR